MENIQCDKMIVKSGNSLALNLTKELKMLDLTSGDVVRVTIEKL